VIINIKFETIRPTPDDLRASYLAALGRKVDSQHRLACSRGLLGGPAVPRHDALVGLMAPASSGVDAPGAGLKVLLTSGYGTESLSPQWALGEFPLITKPYKQAALAMRLLLSLMPANRVKALKGSSHTTVAYLVPPRPSADAVLGS
jgi:hypothetical protein